MSCQEQLSLATGSGTKQGLLKNPRVCCLLLVLTVSQLVLGESPEINN